MRKFLLLAATAALTLASCTEEVILTQDDVLSQVENGPQAIEFGTYMSKSSTTRSGYIGNISTAELKDEAKANGFGVFAYFTGTSSYENFRGNSGSNKYPNFMYNQQVKWTSGRTDYIGNDGGSMWAYSPLKYWPNDFTNSAVDDQTNPATGSSSYGGNLSFFAYAPYVPVSAQTTANGIAGASVEDASFGITAFSGNKYVGDGTHYSDPFITYKMKDDGTKVVDLLWGTLASAGPNAVGTTNSGVKSTGSETELWAKNGDYSDDILAIGDPVTGYITAADLTKQKTNGTIDFAFKHALSKVGGSEKNGSTPLGSSSHGLMIIADIDNQKGAETGGQRGTTPGIDNYTKITVKSISIVAKTKVKDNTDKKPDETGYTDSYLKTIQGLFNLATGKWEVARTFESDNDNIASSVSGLTHIINTTGTSVAAKLNTVIAEPSTTPAKTADGFDGLVAGVPDVNAVNVYATEGDANPLMFIPGTWPELTITVDYIVRTKDANLADAYSQVEQIITKKITFADPVELNKQYNLLIHLGLTSVKFTATVSDWDVETGTPNIDTDGNGTADAHGTDVNIPINVAPAP